MSLVGCVALWWSSGTIADVLVEDRYVVASSRSGRCLAGRGSRINATPTNVPASLSSTTMQNIVWIYHFIPVSRILKWRIVLLSSLVCVCMCVCVHVWHACVCACTHVCMHACVCVCVCVCWEGGVVTCLIEISLGKRILANKSANWKKKSKWQKSLKIRETSDMGLLYFSSIGWFPLPFVKEYTRCKEHQEESHVETDQNVFHCRYTGRHFPVALSSCIAIVTSTINKKAMNGLLQSCCYITSNNRKTGVNVVALVNRF